MYELYHLNLNFVQIHDFYLFISIQTAVAAHGTSTVGPGPAFTLKPTHTRKSKLTQTIRCFTDYMCGCICVLKLVEVVVLFQYNV